MKKIDFTHVKMVMESRVEYWEEKKEYKLASEIKELIEWLEGKCIDIEQK